MGGDVRRNIQNDDLATGPRAALLPSERWFQPPVAIYLRASLRTVSTARLAQNIAAAMPRSEAYG